MLSGPRYMTGSSVKEAETGGGQSVAIHTALRLFWPARTLAASPETFVAVVAGVFSLTGTSSGVTATRGMSHLPSKHSGPRGGHSVSMPKRVRAPTASAPREPSTAKASTASPTTKSRTSTSKGSIGKPLVSPLFMPTSSVGAGVEKESPTAVAAPTLISSRRSANRLLYSSSESAPTIGGCFDGGAVGLVAMPFLTQTKAVCETFGT
mmetsp:Transcript_61726/g.121219  ORF Transcript_61726/g.121219 Transcript_61726/m.121219 type:complete len:208 (-) Transcript_61726:932-1555(-)